MLADRILVLMLGLCLGEAAFAEEIEDESPDIAFLEYLGMWEESDEEWLLHEEMAQAATERQRDVAPGRNDPVSDDEESSEYEDES